MNGVVVDSSVVAKWVLPEAEEEIAARLLATAGKLNRLIVVDLAYIEVTNAIWSRYRRKLIDIVEVQTASQLLFQVAVETERANSLLESALQIGIRYDRAIYDALFVALVAKTGFAGVTADVPLYKAVHGDFPTIVLLRDWK